MATETDWLCGKQVAITGRLTSLSRAEAATLVAANGGQVVAAVNRNTALVIVGDQPLDNSGGLSSRLRRARRLEEGGHPIAILAEKDFLARLGLSSRAQGLYTASEAGRILRVPPQRVHAWLRAGIVEACETVHGVPYFDFEQLSWAKTLCRLSGEGVRPERIRRSLELLGHWLPKVDRPLAQLRLLADGGRLFVRLESGQLAEPGGQAHLDFGDDAVCEAVVAPAAPSAGACFQRGCDLEQQGRHVEAADAYRQALALGGPDADVCFNLANVLVVLGHKEHAVERYRQAVEIDPSLASAWNNLGNVLAERGERVPAVSAYRKALDAAPDYGDALFNLADTLDEMGDAAEARRHWQAFLRRPTDAASARHARSRLAGRCPPADRGRCS